MTTETLLRLAIETSLRVTAVAALVALVLLAARVKSSSVRHAAWVAVLVAMVLMPVLPYCVPALTVSVPAPAMRSVDALTQFVTPFGPPSDLGDAVPPTDPARVTITSAEGSPVLAPAVPAAFARRPVWPAAVAGVYALGFVLLASRLVVGWRRARRLVENRPRRSISTPIEPKPGVCDGNRPPGSIFESALVATPLTVGVLSPRIILPLGWRAWPAEKLHAILAHERAHIERRDPLIAFIAAVNRCVFWFHPLAWWLERKLATMAEHACDEAAVRGLGERRSAAYAEVLLDMAEAARQAGGRLTWQGVGVVNGTSLIAQRIDRILKGDLLREMSRIRKSVVALASAAAIFVAVACHQAGPQAQPAAPLTEDPEIAARLAADKARSVFWAEAQAMTAEQLRALEASVDANPEDMAGRKKLMAVYGVSWQKVVGWNEMIAGRRKQALWLIANRPDDPLTRSATPSFQYDPEGYAEAKRLWLAYLKRPDVKLNALHTAAAFFAGIDNSTAEQILLRGQAEDPKGGIWVADNVVYGSSWSSALGDLYAGAILGLVGPPNGTQRPSFNPEAARSAYAQAIRKKLDDSKDVTLLLAASYRLHRSVSDAQKIKLDFDPEALSQKCVERAVALDPQSFPARRAVASLQYDALWRKRSEVLKLVPIDAQFAKVAALPEAERFALLPLLMAEVYMSGEAADYYRHDAASAKASWDLCKRYADDALRLASKFKNDPQYSVVVNHANLALGVLALRAGNGREAVRYLGEAANVPPSEALAFPSISLEYRLVNTLLQYGERESVAAYFEKTAALSPQQKDRRLKDAAAIRAGRMTESYQYFVTPH